MLLVDGFEFLIRIMITGKPSVSHFAIVFAEDFKSFFMAFLQTWVLLKP